MRYLVIIMAIAAILITQVALFPGQAQAASRDDGIQNQIILVDSRGHRRDRDDWDRRYDRDRRRDRDHWDNRRYHRYRWDDDYYWNRRYYNDYHRPRHRHYDDWDGFYFIGPPIPIPLPLPIPVPPLPPFFPHR